VTAGVCLQLIWATSVLALEACKRGTFPIDRCDLDTTSTCRRCTVRVRKRWNMIAYVRACVAMEKPIVRLWSLRHLHSCCLLLSATQELCCTARGQGGSLCTILAQDACGTCMRDTSCPSSPACCKPHAPANSGAGTLRACEDRPEFKRVGGASQSSSRWKICSECSTSCPREDISRCSALASLLGTPPVVPPHTDNSTHQQWQLPCPPALLAAASLLAPPACPA
jgi:hypothetical protein